LCALQLLQALQGGRAVLFSIRRWAIGGFLAKWRFEQLIEE
jgi:hypothetical protein